MHLTHCLYSLRITTRSAQEPCQSQQQNDKRAPVCKRRVHFFAIRWMAFESLRNVGRVPTKGIQRAPFHQCPVVQRVCNCNNVITSSIQAPMAMSTRIDVRRKVLKISQPFTTCCVSISRTGLSQQLHQCWVTRAVGSADASGSQRSHSPCSAPLCSKIHTVTHCSVWACVFWCLLFRWWHLLVKNNGSESKTEWLLSALALFLSWRTEVQAGHKIWGRHQDHTNAFPQLQWFPQHHQKVLWSACLQTCASTFDLLSIQSCQS